MISNEIIQFDQELEILILRNRFLSEQVEEMRKYKLLAQEQLEEISGLNKKNSLLYEQIGELEIQLNKMQLLIQKLSDSAELLNAEAEKLNTQIIKKDTRIDALSEELKLNKEKAEKTAFENQQLNTEIQLMKNSTSWKITEPLRKISDKFRK